MKQIFTNINSKLLSNIINSAEKKVILITPGINSDIAAALVNAAKRLGNENISLLLT